MAEARCTVARPVRLSGAGIHTGVPSITTLAPGDGPGIVFRRTDLDGRPEIAACLANVRECDRRVVLGRGAVTVSTVEHLLAAAYAVGLDDLTVELNGPEVPALDGSAAPYLAALADAGKAASPGTRRVLRPTRRTVVEAEGSRYVASAHLGLRLTVTTEWPHPLIGRQSGCWDVTAERFATELAGARTFGFRSEAEALRAAGLAGGVTAHNAIILTDDGIENGPLRWPDEPVRHKALDLLGDLALLGARLEAEIVATKPGHRGNVALASALERTAARPEACVMDIEQIMRVLPHRYPMLLVDRIVELEPGKRIVGIKNVTINEPFFQGHFPGRPVMPGVLIVEALAQAGGVLLLEHVPHPETKLVLFMSLDEVKFRKPVLPGDQLRLEVEMLRFGGKTCRMRGIALVDGKPAAEGVMMAAILDR
jgi:UDP-3-O-[3-hydroxymyristoyl] N-acetylglucosamine deacetylase/3-hydroxyacyl-[acyl-carrier-protein] dehydratase